MIYKDTALKLYHKKVLFSINKRKKVMCKTPVNCKTEGIIMRGILLAGGKGSRLFPMTRTISKQLLPIDDKPMGSYPFSVLMLAGIREILVISDPQSLPLYRVLFGDGSHLGLSVSFEIQNKPEGLAQALLIGESFIANEPVCLILGDNFFYGQGFTPAVNKACQIACSTDDAVIFGYPVNEPREFGVVEINGEGRAISIEEKPESPRSSLAVPGVYFYGRGASAMAKMITPSPRGELEITDLNRRYMEQGRLSVVRLGRGHCWLDTGTPSGLLSAGNFVATIQSRQNMYIACLEEIAWRMGFIDKAQLKRLGEEQISSDYGRYILSL
jgi:glucose-1-phosphate thymidylyltransferase